MMTSTLVTFGMMTAWWLLAWLFTVAMLVHPDVHEHANVHLSAHVPSPLLGLASVVKTVLADRGKEEWGSCCGRDGGDWPSSIDHASMSRPCLVIDHVCASFSTVPPKRLWRQRIGKVLVKISVSRAVHARVIPSHPCKDTQYKSSTRCPPSETMSGASSS